MIFGESISEIDKYFEFKVCNISIMCASWNIIKSC